MVKTKSKGHHPLRLALILVLCAIMTTISMIPFFMQAHRTIFVASVVEITDGMVYVYDGQTTMAFLTKDTWYASAKEPGDIFYDELKVGYTYLFDVAGYRIPALGFYEVVIHANYI